MNDRENMSRLLGVEVEEDEEATGYRLSTEYATQVMLELRRRGMMLKDLADLMGVSAATLSKQLGSSSNMTMRTVARIAIALGMEVEAPSLRPPAPSKAPRGLRVLEFAPAAHGALEG